MASFFDQLGAGWSLLVIRYLLIGLKQFKDFLEGSLCIDTYRLSNGLTLFRALKIVEKSDLLGARSRTSYVQKNVRVSTRLLLR